MQHAFVCILYKVEETRTSLQRMTIIANPAHIYMIKNCDFLRSDFLINYQLKYRVKGCLNHTKDRENLQ